MFFETCLYSSLAIFGLGVVYKVSSWFRRSVGIGGDDFSPTTRLVAAVKGIVTTIASPRVFTLLKVLFLDVILQVRVLKEDSFRWLMHMLIYSGFMLLLLMHALGNVLTVRIFDEYYPTVNPFLFLRDLAGILVLIGVAIALYRRFIGRVRYLKTNAMDHYAILIVAVIIISGFLLEGTKIASYSEYQRMVDDYAALDVKEELTALESFWVQKYGVVSPNVQGPFDQNVLSEGRDLHEENCASCHSPQKWAFSGYTLAKITKPFAHALDNIKATTILWYIHFLATFLGLAFLPFSKMFHIIASPISLLANAVMDPKSDSANVVTRQVMELDACTRCRTCSLRCSTAIASEMIDNTNILPSERMISLKAFAAGKKLSETDIRAIQEGIYLCTNCDRCTVVCPVGINLRELWFNAREHLIRKGYTEPLVLSPFSYYRGLNKNKIVSDDYEKPMDVARKAISDKCESMKIQDKVLVLETTNEEFREGLIRSFQGSTYSYCFACENCTTVCPVVGSYENPQKVLDLLPHQIMRSVGLGLKDLAFGSRMLWDCLTCYQCQEHCPQQVNVTDVFYELKNQAIKNSRT